MILTVASSIHVIEEQQQYFRDVELQRLLLSQTSSPPLSRLFPLVLCLIILISFYLDFSSLSLYNALETLRLPGPFGAIAGKN